MADDFLTQQFSPTISPVQPQGVVDPTVIPSTQVVTNGDIAAVPAEPPNGVPTVLPPIEPNPIPTPQPEPPAPAVSPIQVPSELVSESPVSSDDASSSTDEEKTEEATTESGEGEDGEKSPLEILEDILANASAEKELKDKEEAEAQAKEAQEKAEMAAKEAQFQEEAKQKIGEAQVAVAEAKQFREDVDAKMVDTTKVSNALADDLVIKQLKHDTIQQPI